MIYICDICGGTMTSEETGINASIEKTGNHGINSTFEVSNVVKLFGPWSDEPAECKACLKCQIGLFSKLLGKMVRQRKYRIRYRYELYGQRKTGSALASGKSFKRARLDFFKHHRDFKPIKTKNHK